MNKHIKNLIGQKFGRLTPIKYVGKNKYRQSLWLCKCDCGNEKIISRNSLITGNTGSCGCYHKSGEYKIKHGRAIRGRKSRTYQIWKSMKSRCSPKNDTSYKYYAGRNIVICERWANKNNGFQNFLEDMGECPSGLTLERINNNLGYYKENCRWATKKEQGRNRRSTRKILVDGKERLLIEVAEERKISSSLLRQRLKRGCSVDEALNIPIETRNIRPLLLRKYEYRLRNALNNLKIKNKDKIGFSKYLSYNSKQLQYHFKKIKIDQNNSCPICHVSYNIIKYDIDHVVPTSSAENKEKLLKLFDLKNLSLLCFRCNRYIKRNKVKIDNK